MSDPRWRKARHLLTPELLSSSIQITNLPASWNESTISSIVAGSGPIVNVSTRTDPRNGKLLGITVDYATSKDSKRALDVLRKIKKFPCDLERIMPNNKEGKEPRKPLDLNRDAFPWEFGLELPFELVSEVPLPRRPTNPVPVSNSGPSGSDAGGGIVVFPDILKEASKHLPGLQPNSMTSPDAISANLGKIAPLQLLEMISNLKILASQDANRDQLSKFLTSNPDISVAVTQALLEMGFVNYSVVTKVIAEQPASRAHALPIPNNPQSIYSNGSTPGTTPMNNSAPLNTFTAPVQQPQPQQPAPAPAAAPPMMFNAPPAPAFGFNGAAAPAPFMPAPMGAPMGAPMAPPIVPPMPVANGGPRVNTMKLAALPQNQQDMIKQVLQLSPDQIRLLPPDQIAMVENFKREYLM
ncbi:LAQU0S01e12596g1_1 [Lachancea quebecensis]|uniref:LAQU0S01e12596g1_1 n=1 Tax=Lachancea quebecensis TaxID=1654605 RepID=A0A0P1KMK5_9SACH|nr:LAQU0S01e12596g1_1 [Lachancea quebecensis]